MADVNIFIFIYYIVEVDYCLPLLSLHLNYVIFDFKRIKQFILKFLQIKCNFCGGDEVVKTSGKVKIDHTDDESSEINVKKEIKAGAEDVTESTDLNTPLADDNVGTKLLKMMGWSGGGLGKNKQGISEPIKPVDQRSKRAGFGLPQNHKSGPLTFNDIKNEKDLQCIKHIIRDYRYSSDLNDLVFSSEFTKEQRACLHK